MSEEHSHMRKAPDGSLRWETRGNKSFLVIEDVQLCECGGSLVDSIAGSVACAIVVLDATAKDEPKLPAVKGSADTLRSLLKVILESESAKAALMKQFILGDKPND